MSPIPQRRHYLAIFFVSLSLLMLEISFARVLSVALYSHFAFVAISLAMFGLGLSGVIVYLLPARFPADAVDRQVSTFASIFGLSAALGVLVFLKIRVVQDISLLGFATLGFAYAILTVPFFFGGICVSLLMTHFSVQIGRIYFADLLGASLGCLAVVAALQSFPAPHVVLLIALLVTGPTLALAIFARARLALPATAFAIVAVLLVTAFTTDLFTMRYVKNQTDLYSDYEAWNVFSRVSAFDFEPNAAQILPLKNQPPAYADPSYPDTMMLDIDGAAWTPMMGFNGDFQTIQFLRESALYAVHNVKPDADVLIIGTGGGRDLLAAKVFEQRSVTGIEINPLMRHIVEERYGDYSGHPYTLPGVSVIIDEARSHLSTLDRTFDVIQLSLIDTFSLNAAGGFVFSENYLYTVEGFREYFAHLKPDGILALTRYFVPQYPLEILRLLAMARAAWEAEGIPDARNHIVVIQQGMNATMLLKRSPFTAAELATLRRVAGEYNMNVVYSPDGARGVHPDIDALATSKSWRNHVARFPFIIEPPTDDRPFFFNFLRGLIDVPPRQLDPFRFLKLWNDALVLMYMLIGIVTLMAVIFFVGPLLLFGRQRTHHVGTGTAAPLLFYFACLGYGFLMIEIPLLQRFILMLGYPVYALAVVLFSILLFSGIGSLASTRFAPQPKAALLTTLAAVVVLASVYRAVLPGVIDAFLGTPILVRILVTVAFLAPIGFILGMAYPLGITILRRYGEELVPWAWGLNGVLSVVASVFAIFLGSRIGFSGALLTGIGAYALGFACIAIGTRAGLPEAGSSSLPHSSPG